VPSFRRSLLPPSQRSGIFINTATRVSTLAKLVSLYTRVGTSPQMQNGPFRTVAAYSNPHTDRFAYKFLCRQSLFSTILSSLGGAEVGGGGEELWCARMKGMPVTCKDKILQPKAANNLWITSAKPVHPNVRRFVHTWG
jgi:hypothetical protein